MLRQQAIEQLHRTVTALEHELKILQQQLRQMPLLACQVFVLPDVLRGKEHEPCRQITVTPLVAQKAFAQALNHFSLLYMQQQSAHRSTKAAVRLPGAICVQGDGITSKDLRDRVLYINQLKCQTEKIITVDSGVNPEERFMFVHQQLPGLITLNVYRKIVLLDAPNSVRFGWANKHMTKKINRDELRDKLLNRLKSRHSPVGWSGERWAESLHQEIAILESLPPDVQLKIRRPVKVQPIARIWQADIKKQFQLACPAPLLIICQNASQLPTLGELKSYDENMIRHRYKPQAQSLWPLIPRLHLYVEHPD